MRNATDTPQPSTSAPSQVGAGTAVKEPEGTSTASAPVSTPPASTTTAPSTTAQTPTTPSTASTSTESPASSAPTPSTTSPSSSADIALPPVRPASGSSSHPPTPIGMAKSDISDTTERDSSYATALATKVGGSEPAIMSFAPAAGKSDTVPSSSAASTTAASAKSDSTSSTSSAGNAAFGKGKAKKKGGFATKIVGGLVAVFVLAAGLGAGYYLQTQQQDLREQAAAPSGTHDLFNKNLRVHHLGDTSCRELTKNDELRKMYPSCPADEKLVDYQLKPGDTNNVSEYTTRMQLENIGKQTIKLTLETEGWWCEKRPFGESWNLGTEEARCSIGCAGEDGVNTAGSKKEITLEPGTKSEVLSITSKSGNGQACGSYQNDWFITKLEIGGRDESISGNRQLISWGMCQTGNTCEAPTKITGTVQCVNPANGTKYPINSGTVSIGGKTYDVKNGSYTTDDITAGEMIAARLTLPASFSIDVDGTPVTVQTSNTKTQAVNGCDPTFMNANCSGINDQRAQQCANANNLTNSYEWCTLPKSSATRSGFDFLVTNCVTPTASPSPSPSPSPVPLSCVGTTFTPITVVAGAANQMTVTCRAVTGAKSYKLTVPSNTTTQTPVTITRPAPASGNLTYSLTLNAVPAGTYTASCIPCANADGTNCAAATATQCKASVTVTKAITGVATCESKTAYYLDSSGAKVFIAGGSTGTAGGTITPGQEFSYDITLKATSQTTGVVTAIDTLPAKLTFISAKLGTEVVTTPSATSFFRSNTGGKLTFVLPAFGDNATANNPVKQVITVKVKVNDTATPGDVANAVSVTTAGSTNSASSCSHQAVIPPDGIAACTSKEMYAVNGSTVGAKIASGTTIQTGTTLQYRVNLSASSQTAGSVTVTDTLPDSLELVDKLDFDYNASTRVLSKTLPAFQGTKALNARVRVKHNIPSGDLINTAVVKTVNGSNVTVNTNSCQTTMVIPSYACNTSCSANEQCQGVNADYICSSENNNRCRLSGNESSESCQPKTFACNSSCGSDSDCQSVNSNYRCVATSDGNRCRLSSNEDASNCQTAQATPTPTPAVGCNQACTNNADCSNPDHVCHQTENGSVCRLADDVNSTTCSVTQIAQVQPTAPPAELPQSGPENWSNWLKSGLVIIGIGAMLLLLL